ncbi:MAG TPA: SpvB/TcaC N-terminal domain-containing protein, partial [Anaerolineales bacterium]|nr:SpvB/TcaC N-terminal domain-containing protein [Anaerolineales bacterium]
MPNENDSYTRLTPAEAQFDKPVEMTISFDGLLDLATLGAEWEPVVVTLDEASGVWVRVPLKAIDSERNTVTVETTHFSTWGAGVGASFPQNGANVLLFDSARPDLFTGKSHFSIPIWTPPGRAGLAPSLGISYSSGMADGVLGDIQAPWIGMGWSVDSIEIARKITNGPCSPCGNGYYGYKNEFILTFQGIGGELIPDPGGNGRYHTKDQSFLYIQLHNVPLGNYQVGGQSPPNATDEWWEVVTRDGTRWRLGWNADSEQLAAMLGYPGSASGSWAALGYAGAASNVAAARWRADLVTEAHGNTMSFSYFEEQRLVAGTSTNYDRASYLDTIAYTGHTSLTPAPAYSVVLVREDRPAGSEQQPSPLYDWNNWDTKRLDKIEVKYGSTVVRTYDLNLSVRTNATGDTTVLDSVAVSGGGTSAPTVTFTYTDFDNRASGAGSVYPYPRLGSIANGWGATAAFTYANDGRDNTKWYNWRVENMAVTDGIGGPAMQTGFAFTGPCYDEKDGAGWCNTLNKGELIGYAQTTVTSKDFNGQAVAIGLNKFYTDERRAGQTYESQNQDAGGTVLTQSNTHYTVLTGAMPDKVYYPFADATENYMRINGRLTMVNRAEYDYDPATGNPVTQKEYQTPATYLVFENGFESQNLSGWPPIGSIGGWSSSATNNGALSVTKAAHLIDDYGMQAAVSSGNTNPMYVEDNTPIGLWRYRTRLWLDPNSAAIPGLAPITIFEGRDGSTSIFAIQLQKNAGNFEVRARVYADGGGSQDTSWQVIADAPHSVDLYWAADTAEGASDGYLKWAVDGLLRDGITVIDNDTLRLEEVRLGLLNVPSGASGTLYFDGFQSWGHLPAPFRYTEYEYLTSLDLPNSVYIIDRARRQTLRDGNGNKIAETL